MQHMMSPFFVTGFRVGRQLAERYTANRPRMAEPLEVIKFICKEFWAEVFRKQVLMPCCIRALLWLHDSSSPRPSPCCAVLQTLYGCKVMHP